jgi:ATP-binding cassette subfamily F protein 3
MSPSDLLLLDEPTNHLDLDAILWLSDWIRIYQGTLLLISHDREFLDETVNAIAYLHALRIELFPGNYTRFERLKAARLAEQQSNYEKQQRDIQHMQDFVRRFRAKATKARQAQSRIKALERMELIAPAHIDSPFRFEIPATEKTSNPLLQLDLVVAGYSNADPVLSGVRVTLGPGDRVGLLGHNGAGKSTLVKTLSGELPLLGGTRQEGNNLRIAYFSQHQIDELDLRATAHLHLQRLDKDLTEQNIRNFLGGFDFHGDKVFDPVDTFSGGEKARLALALVAYSKPNLLLMDEPTNHLDMEMRQALTVALQAFEGAIVLISHDRHLLANTVDEFMLVHDGRVDTFKGDLGDYRKRLFGELSASTPVTPQKSPEEPVMATPVKSARKKNEHRKARQLRTRLKTIETRLTRLQEKLADIESTLSDASLYSEDSEKDLHQLLRDQVSLKESIAELEEEWLEKTHALEHLES